MFSQPLSDDFYDYYQQGKEESRLLEWGKLEFWRTQELLARYLPEPPATIYDVGGGAGIYAYPLAQQGYTVHLIDAVPLHIEQAAGVESSAPLASMAVGDARGLEFPDASADAVLLLGPLYHLTEREDRLAAIREAHRVLKSGGWLFAATISRFASLRDGFVRGFVPDPYFREIVDRDLTDGQHRNPKRVFGYFSTTYFHLPYEARDEITEAGFAAEAVLPIEGIGDVIADKDTYFADDTLREAFLDYIRRTESEPTLLGVTSHILTVGRKP